MPLMAHKEHGFHQAQSGELAELEKAGWELCPDPIAYKAKAWGIGKVEEPAEQPEELTGEEPAKRRGRPRKE